MKPETRNQKPYSNSKPETRKGICFGFRISDLIKVSSLKFRFSTKGFTLVELIIVIAIVGLVTTVSLANFRAGERSRVLRGAGDEFTGLLRRAEARALSSQVVGDALEPPRAYGVVLKTNRLASLFADIDGDGQADTNIEDLDLVESITAERVGDQITFSVPRGEVKLNGACLAVSPTLTFAFKQITTGNIKNVVINCISSRITLE